jgi:hypothetical protein
MKQTRMWLLAIIAIVALSGCSMRAPTIAHVHIGHALTGWHDTPDKAGLFVVAENKATAALRKARLAEANRSDLEALKRNIAAASQLTDSDATINGHPGRDGYGVKQALTGAVNHITFAATSPDATPNVAAFADGFSANAAGVLDRCDLIVALGQDVHGSQNGAEAGFLSAEIEKLVQANINGEDLDGDGRIGTQPAEYGLAQLRQAIESMIAREDPPYTTVNRWYLFNLIRLPDGSWIFRKREAHNAGGNSYGDGGGSY